MIHPAIMLVVLIAMGTPKDEAKLQVTTRQKNSFKMEESLRLVAEKVRHCAGSVQIYHKEAWGHICDDGWDSLDAEVVCRSLNCGKALRAVGSSAFGIGNGVTWLTELACVGNEQRLFDCPPSVWSGGNCTKKENAGVVCSKANLNQLESEFNKCTGKYYRDEGDDYCIKPEGLRLSGGPTPCEGLLEIKFNGSWGTVCDDGWDSADSKVVCQQLGCLAPFKFQGENGDHLKGQKDAPIVLSNLQCRGNEMALWGCRSTYWLEHECLHKEDVWVICGPLAPVEVYNALQDDFTAVMISIALAVLLVLVSTLLVYQLLRKDQDPPEFYGRQKLGPGEYGIYEDINYGDVKRHSQISHVSEANSSIGKEDFSANMDAVSVGSAAQQKEGYDDVEVDLDLEQMNDEGMSGREDVGDGRLLHAGSNLGRRRSPSADKPMEQTGGRNEGYDDVGSSPGLEFEAESTSDLIDRPAKEYYDDVDDVHSIMKESNNPLQKLVREFYDDINSINDGLPKTGSEKKGNTPDYENIPECSSAVGEKKGQLTESTVHPLQKPGKEYYDDIDVIGSVKEGLPKTGNAKKGNTPDYKNVPESSSAVGEKKGQLTESTVHPLQKPGKEYYDDIDVIGSVKEGLPKTGSGKKGNTPDYENVPECSSAVGEKKGQFTESTVHPLQKPGKEYYDDIDVIGSVKEGLPKTGTSQRGSTSSYENVPECTSAIREKKLQVAGLPKTGNEKRGITSDYENVPECSSALGEKKWQLTGHILKPDP